MPAYVGIDWSENEQDWFALDDGGKELGHGIVHETVADLDRLDQRLRALVDPDTGELPLVGCETGKGLLVSYLRQRGYTIYNLNPLTVSTYRPRVKLSRSKSDQADAKMIANILRNDRADYRAMPNITDQGASIGVLARAEQREVWRINSITLEMRSLLRLYYPAALTVWKPAQFSQAGASAVLLAAPNPTAAHHLTEAKVRRMLFKAKSYKDLDKRAAEWTAKLQRPWPTLPPYEEVACGMSLEAMLHTLQGAAAAQQIAAGHLVAAVQQHPLYPFFDSVKGMGDLTAGRLLGEIGDDLDRFATSSGLKAFAGTAPITRDSGNRHVVVRRVVKSNRLAQATWMWAFTSLRCVPGAKAYYDRRRAIGDKHAAALRNMGNKMLGALWHCMITGQLWDDEILWGRFVQPLALDPITPEDELEGALEVIKVLEDLDQGDQDAADEQDGDGDEEQGA